jgi:glycosyltransferase involved in cell wall biosynthesis
MQKTTYKNFIDNITITYEPLISIIIPVYNLSNFVLNSLDSLLQQIDQNFECIIIDDGSTDDTVSIIKAFIEHNILLNIKLLQKKNGGVSSARNLGILESKCKYLLFFDGDDFLSKDLTLKINILLKNSDNDFIFWNYHVISEDKTIINNQSNQINTINQYDGFFLIKSILKNNSNIFLWTASVLYRKDIVINNKLAFNENSKNGEDQEFLFKYLLFSKNPIHIESFLSSYFQRSSSISNTFNIRRFDFYKSFNSIAAFYDHLYPNELSSAIIYIKSTHIVSNFFYNYYSSYLALKKFKRGKQFNYVDFIEKELKIHYKNLIESLKFVRYSNLSTFKLKFSLFCYNLNPILYIFYANFSTLLANTKRAFIKCVKK